jgi:polyisoprenoid-binding protein YceI
MDYRKLTMAFLIASVTTPVLADVETYLIDPDHTYPSIEFSHMGISVWRGKFDRTQGTISIDRTARTGTVDVVIDTDSLDFGLASMHTEARSDHFFDVAKFPTATYRGTLTFVGKQPRYVDGAITLMGVTRPVKLRINLLKCMAHPMTKQDICGADAEGDLNWGEYGMAMSKFAEGDAGKVHLRIQVEARKIKSASPENQQKPPG